MGLLFIGFFFLVSCNVIIFVFLEVLFFFAIYKNNLKVMVVDFLLSTTRYFMIF